MQMNTANPRRFSRRLTTSLLALICAVGITPPRNAHADSFVINTIGGPVVIDIGHVGPEGSLVPVSTPQSTGFRPPTIFSAPLPSGSGARALGFAGSFTAIADDATAASWNPAGLVQLERGEASFVLRAGHEVNQHHSDSASYRVGENEFDSSSLNYLSFVCPFWFMQRNFVFSANYQEAYDFTQRYTAEMDQSNASQSSKTSSGTYQETLLDHYSQGYVEIDVTSHLTTEVTSSLREILSSGSVTGIDFEQEGTIDAVTYALASEITPKFSVGMAVNFYQDGMLGGPNIRSRTTARYRGDAVNRVSVTDNRVTTGTYTYTGVFHSPGSGSVPVPIDIPISGTGSYPAMTGTDNRQSSPRTLSEGVYEELNEYDGLRGVNGTFGVLWAVSQHLSLALDMDMPWTAKGTQTKTTRNTITSYNATRTAIIGTSESENVETKGIEFDFPLYWAFGSVWRWSQELYSSLDISQTLWSDFAFQATGEQKLNPMDGSAHGENPIDDCWSVRLGTEYLWVLQQTEVPFRFGVSWEQRPAVGSPDQYWGLSLGSGVSIGKDPGRVILDIAYMFTYGDNVLESLVPEQKGLSTDVQKHQVYLSGIIHF